MPGNENHLEVTYQAQVTPWLVLQPDFQYVWHPQGGTSDPRYASGLKRVGNETIFGIHTNVNF
ncbi:porin B carbohydrate-selective OprB [Novacetimonas hansenii ATCC 23769]|uniref:Porin B carbohydrate-selective OprB n=1 Tax=Novacetimonas hansenii ATCC 23769 TaxID=714995 RepID=D5QI88_NOVHA|nr:porin B carbohydrate-selective OprB [Novacetimonas hansenii ATCC 23769]